MVSKLNPDFENMPPVGTQNPGFFMNEYRTVRGVLAIAGVDCHSFYK